MSPTSVLAACFNPGSSFQTRISPTTCKSLDTGQELRLALEGLPLSKPSEELQDEAEEQRLSKDQQVTGMVNLPWIHKSEAELLQSKQAPTKQTSCIRQHQKRSSQYKMASLFRFVPSNSEISALRGSPSAQVAHSEADRGHWPFARSRVTVQGDSWMLRSPNVFYIDSTLWSPPVPLLKYSLITSSDFPKSTSSSNSFVICSVTTLL